MREFDHKKYIQKHTTRKKISKVIVVLSKIMVSDSI